MGVFSGLEPKAVFDYFEKLGSVPHGSGNTKQISDMLVGFARDLGLRYRQDALNNVIIWKDASPGYEHADTVMLQGHMDMVCAKAPGCTKDMATEGLDLMTDGEWVWAKDTTLGGDDCIAVAMALAILSDDTLPHPPLEVVITVDEETGMDGAFGLDCSDLKAKMLLNLDSEDEGVLTVGCAGGLRMDVAFPGVPEALGGGEKVYEVALKGLLGGHSGAEIHKGRLSANTGLVRILWAAEDGALRLCGAAGGKFDNVICPEARATVAVPAEKAAAFEKCVADMAAALKNEYATADPGLTVTCVPAAAETALTAADTRNALRCLIAMPQGVQEMSADVPGLVQTSLNLGVLGLDAGGLHASWSLRSSLSSQKAWLRSRVAAIAEMAGAAVDVRGDYPGWQYRRESRLRDTVAAVYRRQTGKDGRIEAIHAGLECGLFIDKMPGLDAVSIGPELHDIHTPAEHLNVASTARLYALVCEVLAELK